MDVGHLMLRSAEVMQRGFAEHDPEPAADMVHFTDALPPFQVSEILPRRSKTRPRSERGREGRSPDQIRGSWAGAAVKE